LETLDRILSLISPVRIGIEKIHTFSVSGEVHSGTQVLSTGKRARRQLVMTAMKITCLNYLTLQIAILSLNNNFYTENCQR